MHYEEEIQLEMAKKQTRQAFIRYSLYPLALLAIMLTFPLPLYYLGLFPYTLVMPDVLAITGIVVIFLGAFYDFGAKKYVSEIAESRLPFSNDDLNYIYKQQLKLTGVYAIVGFLFFISAVIIFAF
ncbi:MAG: hypothetical protein M1422_00375 [Candidatus Thermoplasmatota archaeon]|nr:hypothetical protein [Candidatus Sysuiplasma jiujiangense]MBX8640589.1 hypothetical protein [Candidatus Sysuiplasma jiujiangense]MBX8642081.1 hypothetical protein [Candidatus Sysuiplasma jiujiangense]MCL4316716.1 hypothetical protein [Candidatus Thermoplasmatota archaeon]MCL5254184.1 hypothetical protein [Candidatus Thermoplasmatota archaeon]